MERTLVVGNYACCTWGQLEVKMLREWETCVAELRCVFFFLKTDEEVYIE